MVKVGGAAVGIVRGHVVAQVDGLGVQHDGIRVDALLELGVARRLERLGRRTPVLGIRG